MAKILIIDDDQAITTVFETTLKKEGFNVITAPDGQSGIEKAKAEKPDLILLDQILPDIKGNEVLKTLKADPATQNIIIALLSNFGQNELVQEAINSGAADYILKYQVEPSDLIIKVKDLLKGNQENVEPNETSSVN